MEKTEQIALQTLEAVKREAANLDQAQTSALEQRAPHEEPTGY